MHQKGQECSGGKKAKIQLTVSLSANMVGDKEKKANKKAWMTSSIFETWSKKFGMHMGHKGRKVLLFLDNALPHSDVQLCNVKLKFLPTNTISFLQPLTTTMKVSQNTVTIDDYTNGNIKGKRLLPTNERKKYS